MARPIPETSPEVAEKFFDEAGRRLLAVANSVFENSCDYKIIASGTLSDPAFKVLQSHDTKLVLSHLYDCVVLEGAYITSAKYKIVAPVGYVKDLIGERFMIFDRLNTIPSEDMILDQASIRKSNKR